MCSLINKSIISIPTYNRLFDISLIIRIMTFLQYYFFNFLLLQFMEKVTLLWRSNDILILHSEKLA